MDDEEIPQPVIHIINSADRKGKKRKHKTSEKMDYASSLMDNDDVGNDDLSDEEQEDEAEEKQVQNLLSPEEKKRRQQDKDSRTIFVGNLPSNIERRTLRKHFKSCGDIESVRLRGIIPEKITLHKRVAALKRLIHEKCKTIFGYVVFRKKESVDKALEMNTTEVGGNYITVQRLGQTKFDDESTVFLGNLPVDVQENDIRSFFNDCGRISGVRVVRDSATGIGKGFGFVSFYSRDGVVLALEKNGAEFESRRIRVMKAGKSVENCINAQKRLKGKKHDNRSSNQKVKSASFLAGERKKGAFDKKKKTNNQQRARQGDDNPSSSRWKDSPSMTKGEGKKKFGRENQLKKHVFSGETTHAPTKKMLPKRKLLRAKRNLAQKKKIAKLLTASK